MSKAVRTVTVASYNLLHGINLRSGRIDLGAVAAAIAGLSADVVALQEVDRHQRRSGAADQVRVLADRLGWHAAFGPALLGSPDTRWTLVGDHDPGGPAYGVGLLSARPLRAIDRHRLPGGGAGRRGLGTSLNNPGYDREPRVALSATLGEGREAVRITTTHLSYLPWRGLAQLAKVLTLAADGPRPAVLAGDLNLPAMTVRALARAGAVRWLHAGGAPTYPAWNPRMQTDQLLVRGGLAVERSRVDAAATSDHLPLIATLRLTGE